jgi:hypothetical protein
VINAEPIFAGLNIGLLFASFAIFLTISCKQIPDA